MLAFMRRCTAWGKNMHEHASSETGAAVQVRLRGPVFTLLENWRRSQPKIPARSEALRILVEHALADSDRSSEVVG
jgi:hypothetical protein